jgi:UDP-N-acetylmuramoyl-tripeptide--D-alanyl-D-alanine ligase
MVGARAAEIADELIVVGSRAHWMAEEAARAGMPAAHIASLASNQEAVDLLGGQIRSGDVVLIKGSRGMHMDEIVSALGVGTS